MKSFLPWVVAVLALGGVWFLYSANQSKSATLAAAQQELQELESLRTENAELKANQVSAAEVERLRKDNRDLPRLRNEVHQLRTENQQLTQRAVAAQADVQRAQARVEAAQLQAQALATNIQSAAQQMSPEMIAAFRQRYGLQVTPQQQQLNACINNLRQLDGAKQQWALENRKTAEAIPGVQDVAPYLPGNAIPQCPVGGMYTLNSVAAHPTCSLSGHVLPQ